MPCNSPLELIPPEAVILPRTFKDTSSPPPFSVFVCIKPLALILPPNPVRSFLDAVILFIFAESPLNSPPIPNLRFIFEDPVR